LRLYQKWELLFRQAFQRVNPLKALDAFGNFFIFGLEDVFEPLIVLLDELSSSFTIRGVLGIMTPSHFIHHY